MVEMHVEHIRAHDTSRPPFLYQEKGAMILYDIVGQQLKRDSFEAYAQWAERHMGCGHRESPLPRYAQSVSFCKGTRQSHFTFLKETILHHLFPTESPSVRSDVGKRYTCLCGRHAFGKTTMMVVLFRILSELERTLHRTAAISSRDDSQGMIPSMEKKEQECGGGDPCDEIDTTDISIPQREKGTRDLLNFLIHSATEGESHVGTQEDCGEMFSLSSHKTRHPCCMTPEHIVTAAYFFSSGNQTSPLDCIRSLALQLVAKIPMFAIALWNVEDLEGVRSALQGNPPHGMPIEDVLQHLILSPMRAVLKSHGPRSLPRVVLLIDALDECEGVNDDVDAFAKVLQKVSLSSAGLPSNMVVIATSARDINVTSFSIKKCTVRVTDDIFLLDLKSDMTHIARFELEKLSKKIPWVLRDVNMDECVRHVAVGAGNMAKYPSNVCDALEQWAEIQRDERPITWDEFVGLSPCGLKEIYFNYLLRCMNMSRHLKDERHQKIAAKMVCAFAQIASLLGHSMGPSEGTAPSRIDFRFLIQVETFSSFPDFEGFVILFFIF